MVTIIYSGDENNEKEFIEIRQRTLSRNWQSQNSSIRDYKVVELLVRE